MDNMKFKEMVIHTYLDTENYKQWFATVTVDWFIVIQHFTTKNISVQD